MSRGSSIDTLVAKFFPAAWTQKVTKAGFETGLPVSLDTVYPVSEADAAVKKQGYISPITGRWVNDE